MAIVYKLIALFLLVGAEGSNETQARRLSKEACRVVRADGNRPPRVNMPTKEPRSARMSSSQCRKIKQHLDRKGMTKAAEIFKFICADDNAEYVPTMGKGCLYVPSDEAWTVGTALHLGKINARAQFMSMIKESFFTGWPCPTQQSAGQTYTTRGEHMTVTTCDDGFVASDGSCISALQKGTVGKVKIFELEGLLGVGKSWYSRIAMDPSQRLDDHTQHSPRNEERPRSSRRVDGPNVHVGLTVTYPVSFVICSPSAAVEANISNYVMSEWITDQMIQEQVDVLNVAYAGQDTCEIMVYDQQKDPIHINWVLRDITRITDDRCQDAQTSPNSVIDLYPQEPDHVKVLVAYIEALGYASFHGEHGWNVLAPGTLPGSWSTGLNLGKTLVHEMGHWLYLYHTFQGGCDDGDGCTDTEWEASSFFGCPNNMLDRRATCGSPDPIHNYMDYGDDRCMCGFTSNQKFRIWDCLETYFPTVYATATTHGQPTPPPTEPVWPWNYPHPDHCGDTDPDWVDSYGDGCAGYAASPSWCTSSNMPSWALPGEPHAGQACCVCGGGQIIGGPECPQTCSDATGTDYTCDELVISAGYTCETLESYGCNCYACSCDGIPATPAPTPPTCGGKKPCDDNYCNKKCTKANCKAALKRKCKRKCKTTCHCVQPPEEEEPEEPEATCSGKKAGNNNFCKKKCQKANKCKNNLLKNCRKKCKDCKCPTRRMRLV